MEDEQIKQNTRESIQISMNPPDRKEDTREEVDFNYSEKMDEILVNKFSEFGIYRDFENLIKNANRFYDDKDEISTYHKLLVTDETRKLQDIIFNKKDPAFVSRFNLEATMICEVDEEIDRKIKARHIFIY